jgi:hypothetical protein
MGEAPCPWTAQDEQGGQGQIAAASMVLVINAAALCMLVPHIVRRTFCSCKAPSEAPDSGLEQQQRLQRDLNVPT